MAVIGISYNDGNKKNLGYESVDISYGSSLNKKKVFNSGDFVKDWYDCNAFIIHELIDTEYHFSNSSSVDHFIMDGAPYKSAYLKTPDGGTTWILDYEYDAQNQGVEFFVNENEQPTWEELKLRYKTNK